MPVSEQTRRLRKMASFLEVLRDEAAEAATRATRCNLGDAVTREHLGRAQGLREAVRLLRAEAGY